MSLEDVASSDELVTWACNYLVICLVCFFFEEKGLTGQACGITLRLK
jgi:hypothetical protein